MVLHLLQGQICYRCFQLEINFLLIKCLYILFHSRILSLILILNFTHIDRAFDTYAKVIVNAGGPFCDSVGNLVDRDAEPMICPSSGVHIVHPDYYSPEGMGLIVPKNVNLHFDFYFDFTFVYFIINFFDFSIRNLILLCL